VTLLLSALAAGVGALPAAPEGGLSDPAIADIRAAARQRIDGFFRRDAGKPLRRGTIKQDWNDRGDYTRDYGHTIVEFAMRAFYLNEQVAEANAALREVCQYHLDRPKTLLEIHSFPSICDPLARLSLFYGPQGSKVRDRLTAETHAILLQTMWAWASAKSKLTEAELDQSQTWWLENSENHHAQHFSTCWSFARLLTEAPGYRDRKYEDGHTPQEHYAAWTRYLREYLRQRAQKGMLVEIDSPSYGAATLKAIYSLYDFSDDPVLRQRAGHFLTLFWAMWAEQQLDAVAGGAKTRCYPASAQRGDDFIRRAAWYALGVGDPNFVHAAMLPFVTTTWEMPDVVIDLALDARARGTYTVRQRRIGLVEAGYSKPPHYRLRSDAGGLLRYSSCTPGFIMSSLAMAARPEEDWAAISSQNRWLGVIFRGAVDARIYPTGYNSTGESTHNATWAVQSESTMIAQKLKASRGANEWRVWFSTVGLSAPVSAGPWVFAEAAAAFVGVRVVQGESGFVSDSGDKRGRWLKCADDFSPVIIEVAPKKDGLTFRAFQQTVTALPVASDGRALSYTSLRGDRFTFFTDQSEVPRINEKPVDLAPAKVFDSPFVQSAWNSGVITVQKGSRKLRLDFNQ
jgi:hypothetical protein